MVLFSIVCTTCQAKLRVRDESAIGKILACPKCGSMVMVDGPAPAGGVSISDTPTSDTDVPATPVDTGASDASPNDALPSDFSPAHVSPVHASPSPHSPKTDTAPTEQDRPPASAAKPGTPPPRRKPRFRGEYPENGNSPPLDRATTKPPAKTVAGAAGSPVENESPVLPGDQWASPATRQLKQIVVLLGAAVFGIALAVGLIAMIASWRAGPDPNDAEQDAQRLAQDTASDSPESKTDADDSNADDSNADDVEHVPPKATPETPDIQNTDQADAMEAGTPSTTTEAPSEPVDGSTLPDVPTSTTDNPPGLVPPNDTDSGVPADNAEPGMTMEPTTPPDTATVPGVPSANSDSEFVKSQLSFVFNSVQETEISLADLAAFVTDLTTIPVTIDLDSLAASGITANSPCSFEHRGITIEQLLSSALEAEGMAFVVHKRQIIVTSAEAAEGVLTERTYNVADLIETDEELQALSTQLTEFIQPTSWSERGGLGSMAAEEYSLVVEQFPAVHYQLDVMMDRLRLARGLLPRSDLPVEWLTVEPAYQRAASALSTPITVNYSTPTPISQILAYLDGETDFTILVNWHTVTTAGWAPNSPSQLVATDDTLVDLLAKWLAPSKLAFRVVDEQTIQITSLEALEARPDIEFYRLDSPPDLVNLEGQLREELKRETAIPIVFDEPSRSLIVSLPQTQQTRVADALKELTKGQ